MIGDKLGAGREADVHAWGEDAVVKLYRPGFGGHRAEAAALAGLAGHGFAPRLIDVVDCGGRTGLVLERLDGLDMLTLLQRQPWQVLGQGRALAGAHLAVHAVRAPGGFPDLREVLAARIEDAGLSVKLRDFAVRVLDGLPGGDRVCHGDYHPGNVLVADDRVSVIDWVGAACGVPEADHARTLLLLRRADPPSGTPTLSRALLAAGRSALTHGYARAYTAGSPSPLRQVDSWLVVHTAARLSEGIDTERPALIALLDRDRHRATQ
nr:phosphotransferase [Micromonospora sp. DSM 115978]